jgi:hypothetical protein
MTAVKVPIIAVLLLIVIYAMTIPAMQQAARNVPVVAQRSAYPAISEGGNFNPKDLCDRYNAAFKLAGAPNMCTEVQRIQIQANIGVVEVRQGQATMFHVDYGTDWSETYGHYNLPAGKRVWQTSLMVFDPYRSQGIGGAVVDNYEVLLKMLGAQSGDIELLVANPARSMPSAARAAWEDFVTRTCIKWDATPINSITPYVGCWRFIP